MRIHVTGNAGAGKTTLARRLEKELGIQAICLDRVVWKSGWLKASAEERRTALMAIMRRPAWIVEGVSKEVRDAADLVVYLDVPRRVCFWRCAKRNWRYLFKSRPELPAGCPEWRIIPVLVRIIWRFPRLVGRAISEEAKSSRCYVVLRDRESIERWITDFVAARVAFGAPLPQAP